jgi:hypothetical protein
LSGSNDQAFVAVMGPVAGFLGTLVTYMIYLWTGNVAVGAAVFLSAMLNLANLIPLSFVDGGRIARYLPISKRRYFGIILIGFAITVAGGYVAHTLPGLSTIFVVLGSLGLVGVIMRGPWPEDQMPKARSGWLYGLYGFTGFACLALAALPIQNADVIASMPGNTTWSPAYLQKGRPVTWDVDVSPLYEDQAIQKWVGVLPQRQDDMYTATLDDVQRHLNNPVGWTASGVSFDWARDVFDDVPPSAPKILFRFMYQNQMECGPESSICAHARNDQCVIDISVKTWVDAWDQKDQSPWLAGWLINSTVGYCLGVPKDTSGVMSGTAPLEFPTAAEVAELHRLLVY